MESSRRLARIDCWGRCTVQTKGKWLIFIGACALVAFYGAAVLIHARRDRDHVRNYALVSATLDACDVITSVTGRENISLAELEDSSYYPCLLPLDKLTKAQIAIVDEGSNADPAKRYCRLGEPGRTSRIADYFYKRSGPALATKRMMSWYLSGVRRRTSQIQQIQRTYAEGLLNSIGSGQPVRRLMGKRVPTAGISGDLPRNPGELQAYVNWLKQTEGLPELTDAWGHPLSFSINGRELVCRSSGPDGEMGTSDDIVERAPQDSVAG